jgi:hypothetical protein
MLVKEMSQRHEQFLRMPDAAGAECLVNVVSDHDPDGFPAMGLLQQIVCQAVAAISGMCSCSLMAATSSSSSPQKAMQSSKEIMTSSNLYTGSLTIKATVLIRLGQNLFRASVRHGLRR